MSNYERLRAQDRLFLDVEDGMNNMHIGGCFIFDAGPLTREGQGIDIEEIIRYIESRLYRIPRYRQRIEFTPIEGHPVWVDDANFNIRYHVRDARLPLPGDERQLKRLCGRIVSQQLDRHKPLWEFYVVGGLEGDRFAVITKVHHCLADGISGVDLLQNLLSMQPLKEFESPPHWYPRSTPAKSELLRDAISRRTRVPLEIASGLLRAAREPGDAFDRARDVVDGFREVVDLDVHPASETPLNRRLGPHRRYDWLRFDLDDMNQVRRALGGTLNDLVLAVVAGAVGRFFERRGISQAAQRKLDFRIACPQSLRPSGDRDTYGNQVAMLFVDVPIAERNPRELMTEVCDAMARTKKSKQSRAMQALSEFGDWGSPELISIVTRFALRQRPSNMVVTNVPGPRQPLYLLDARLLETYPVVPLMPEQALGIALFSYGGTMHWGINSDWDLVPDLHDFVEALEGSYASLRAAAEEVAATRPPH